jgi:four helix bundle protein
MTAKSYRDLICWQLSAQLRDELIAITDRLAVGRDHRLREQIGQSSRSAAANIAEGFGRSDSDFRRFLQIALGSLRETENHVDEVFNRRFLTADEHAKATTLDEARAPSVPSSFAISLALLSAATATFWMTRSV